MFFGFAFFKHMFWSSRFLLSYGPVQRQSSNAVTLSCPQLNPHDAHRLPSPYMSFICHLVNYLSCGIENRVRVILYIEIPGSQRWPWIFSRFFPRTMDSPLLSGLPEPTLCCLSQLSCPEEKRKGIEFGLRRPG